VNSNKSTNMDASEDLPRVGDVDAAVTVAAKEATDNFLNQGEAEDVAPPEKSTEVQQKQKDSDEMTSSRASADFHHPELMGDAQPTAPTQSEESTLPFDISTSTRNNTKKRIRRVGKIPIAKVVKLSDDTTPSENLVSPDVDDTMVIDSAATAVAAPKEEDTIEEVALEQPPPPVVSTKHDEKWNERFDKLLEYKAKNGNTMVPQCYQDDTRLGRWVHYQRVEYWLHQDTGHAKITNERIARLDAIGFEWDPQKAIWNIMYEKLKVVGFTVQGLRRNSFIVRCCSRI
jgi:hypothetical protein